MILESVRRTIRRYGLLPDGSRVLVALSGGADSVALLTVLRLLAETEPFLVIGAVHLNHQLRGPEADGDERFCRELAVRFDLPLHVERADVRALAKSRAISIEHAAHDARHELFHRSAERHGATAVAVAHTKDDQAETFLLRLLRGAGPRGLSGMHPRSGLIIRPLLGVTRQAVREFLDSRKLTFREDASNRDVVIPRNRVRHELLPLLASRFTPNVVDVLAREAAIAREDAEYLDAVADELAGRLLRPTREGVEIAVDELLAEAPAIQRRLVRLAQQQASGGRFMDFHSVDAVLQFAVSNQSGPLDLPGHRVNRRGGHVVLTRSRGRAKAAAAPDFAYQLDIPGHVAVPEADCAISADIRTVPLGTSPEELWRSAPGRDQAVVAAASLAAPLSVRNRRRGDRFSPLGLRGGKSLQDYFVDLKVDRSERAKTPVVVDSTGRIVWVAGHALAEEFRVTDATRDVVILKRVPI